jgi:hypothetical protein
MILASILVTRQQQTATLCSLLDQQPLCWREVQVSSFFPVASVISQQIHVISISQKLMCGDGSTDGTSAVHARFQESV